MTIKIAVIALTIQTHRVSLYPHLPLYMDATCQRFMGYLHLMPALLLPDYLMSREFFKKVCINFTKLFETALCFLRLPVSTVFFVGAAQVRGSLFRVSFIAAVPRCAANV